MLVIANPAKPVLLAKQRPYLNQLTLRLFQNDIEPDGATEAADFTEADFAGYAPVVGLRYTAPFLNAQDEGEMRAPVVNFVATSGAVPNEVYGYYVTDAVGYLIFSERNPAGPLTLDEAGANYPVLLKWKNQTLD